MSDLFVFVHRCVVVCCCPQCVSRVPFAPCCRALSSPVPQMQSLALQLLPQFQNALDFALMKAAILPLVQAACINTQRTDVRVQSLVCIGSLLPSFDKWLMKESILPFLLKLPSREPGVVMAFFGVIKMAVSDSKLVPPCTPAPFFCECLYKWIFFLPF